MIDSLTASSTSMVRFSNELNHVTNLGEETLKALQAYAEDVRAGRFPEAQHTYNMVEGELPRLIAALKE
jgi:ketopantoate hydroxymethyltransferase